MRIADLSCGRSSGPLIRDSDPDARCDIKVVVYRGGELNEMQRLFPVNRARRQDFRYFEYHDAVNYLNRKISSLDQEDASWAIDLRQRLIETRERIENFLQPCRQQGSPSSP